jgi:hypothetical protein
LLDEHCYQARPPLLIAALSLPTFAQLIVHRVYVGPNNQINVAYGNGETAVVRGERGQIGAIQTATDGHTAGWVVLYQNPMVGAPIAGTIVLWRSGKVIRRFRTQQTFWSWGFYANGKQVAYHVGPMHGELSSHCELRDIASGHLLGSWTGDLENHTRPTWTMKLTH